ncbi:hypothetical protein MRX96_010320 [Rhipicephalus microplus]
MEFWLRHSAAFFFFPSSSQEQTPPPDDCDLMQKRTGKRRQPCHQRSPRESTYEADVTTRRKVTSSVTSRGGAEVVPSG